MHDPQIRFTNLGTRSHKVYQTSTHFWDGYHYIMDGKLPSGAKAQTCIWAEALNYVVINNFLFRIDTHKDKD